MTWKRLCIFWMAVSLVLVYLLGITVPMACSAELKLYDAMTFKGKPPSVELECTRLPMLYQWALHGGGQIPNSEIDYTRPAGKYYAEFAEKAKQRGDTVVCLNLEAWPVLNITDRVLVERHVRNRRAALALMRDEAPSVRWYAYDWGVDNQTYSWVMAIDRVKVDYWWEWQRFNEQYSLPVLKAQSAIFPSCYIRKGYSDERYKRINGSAVCEIQRLVPDKPVYPFLRFRHADGSWVPAKRMRMAVEYLRSLDVDGFVLWSMPSASVPWEGEPSELFEVIKEAAQ